MKETRIFAAPVEVREATDSVATIAGYGAVFGNEYQVGDFTESVSRTAFDKTLAERKDLAVVSYHDVDRVLGTQESGTARFSTDAHGLRYEADLDLLDPDGISMQRKVATGKVRQSSFAFRVVRDSWEERDGAPPHRSLDEVRLYECSPVLYGANPATDVDVERANESYAEYRKAHEDPATTREATTETPVDAPPAEAPVATSPPEPKRTFHPFP